MCEITNEMHAYMHMYMHMHIHHAYTRIIIHAHLSCMHTPPTAMYTHARTYSDLASSTGEETLAIFSRSATSMDVVLLKIFQEFEAGEIIVKIDMVVLSLQVWGECLHNSRS